MAFKENLSVFFNVRGFAVYARIRVGRRTRRIKVIFDEPYLNPQLGEYDMETREPRFTCKESDVRGLARGDTVDVHGKTFDVLAVEPDGTGIAIVRLAC